MKPQHRLKTPNSIQAEGMRSDLAQAFPSSHIFPVILQVGSAHIEDSSHDIDFLILYKGKLITAHKMISQFMRDCHDAEQGQVCDDALQFKIKDAADVSFAFYEYIEFFELIKNYLEGKSIHGQHRPWAIGYWIPEALLHDLKNSLIVSGDSKLRALKRKISTYPAALREKIIETTDLEISIKAKLHTVPLIGNRQLSDIILASFRRAFAVHKVYLRGFKRLNEQAKGSGSAALISAVKRINKKYNLSNEI